MRRVLLGVVAGVTAVLTLAVSGGGTAGAAQSGESKGIQLKWGAVTLTIGELPARQTASILTIAVPTTGDDGAPGSFGLDLSNG